MSWKTNTIVVRPSLLGADPDELLRHLGYEKRRKSKEVIFGGGIGGASIWIGTIDDRILMYTHLAGQFFDRFCDGAPDRDFTFLKSALFQNFPEVRIAALYLDSVVDAWGFAVFRGGALVRRFYGHDGTILGDEGSQLPEENAYLANYDRLEVMETFFTKTVLLLAENPSVWPSMVRDCFVRFGDRSPGTSSMLPNFCESPAAISG